MLDQKKHWKKDVAIFLAIAACNLPMTAAVFARGPVDARTLAALLKQGEDAFDTGNMNDARDAFADALQVDPMNQAAARALGIVYLHLDKPAKAAEPLEIASGTKVMDRSLVLALSSERLATHSPMQAVKYIKNYLEAHPSPPAVVDEPMLNALGISLSQAETAGNKSSLFTDATKFYKKLNARLEATRPGEKRWGTEWIPAADVDTKQESMTTSLAMIQTNSVTVRNLASNIADAERAKAAVPYAEGENTLTEKRAAIQSQIDQMTSDQKAAQKNIDDAQATLASVKPKWPEEISVDDMVLVDVDVKPAQVVTPKTVAVAPVVPDQKPVPTPVTPPTPADTGTNVDVPKPKPVSHHGTRYAVAFAVAPDLVVTSSATLTDATDIQLEPASGPSLKAEIVRSDDASGLTLLRVTGAHFYSLPIGDSPIAGPAKCDGLPDVNIFSPLVQEMTATLSTAGDKWSIKLAKRPRLPGGPLLQNGKVVGVEMGDRDTNPEAVPVVTVDAIKQLLQSDANAKSPAINMKDAVFQVVAAR
jgi:tetratricopeptide (TPR) repeat protein